MSEKQKFERLVKKGKILKGRIERISGVFASGLWQIWISGEGGNIYHLDSGYGARSIANAFGSLEESYGKEIYYNVDSFGVLEAFTPCDEVE